MIKYNTVLQCMKQLPKLLAARESKLTNKDIKSMVDGASIEFVDSKSTPHSKIVVQTNMGNAYHYVFAFSGCTGKVQYIHRYNVGIGQWEDVLDLDLNIRIRKVTQLGANNMKAVSRSREVLS